MGGSASKVFDHIKNVSKDNENANQKLLLLIEKKGSNVNYVGKVSKQKLIRNCI